MSFEKNIEVNSPSNLTKIVGEVTRIVFCNETNGYCILKVTLPKGGAGSPNNRSDGSLTVKLTRPNTAVGMTLEFHGKYIIDPKYGHQFKAETANEVPPSTREGMISYLSSSFFHGIGPVKARNIVKKFKENTLDIFNNDIDRLLEVPGITEKNLASIKIGWEKNKEINNIMQFLMEHGLSSAFAGRVYEYYGNNCVDQIRRDPYELSRHVSGIGFKKSDAIALSLGFAEDSPLRIKACVEHVISSSEEEGHCYLYRHQIISKSEELLGVDMGDHILGMLTELEFNGSIIVLRSMMDEERYYGSRIYRNESFCYRKLNILKQRKIDIAIDEHELFEHIKENISIELSDQQKKAVIGILRSNVSILTGSPGTGKTSSTKALVEALDYIGINFLLCAPTGRAAKRMTNVIGYDASTIHRLLSWDPSTGGFAFNEKNQLKTQCVLIDEFSMVDIHLASALLRAIPDDARVVFIGDPDQLPPVGAGNFFRDAIDSEAINVFRLTQIFRQGKGSQIIDYSHSINKGEIPNIETPLINTELWKSKEMDCLFIDSGMKDPSMSKEQIPPWSSLRYGFDVVDMIIELYRNTIPKYYNHPKDIQVLIPMKKGPLGTIEVNKRIQEAINPKRTGINELKVRDVIFREHDKVIQTVNNYNLNVFNGDVGRIVSINEERGLMSVDYDNSIITYERSDMLDLELAYSISIHKSQGSEFEFVILPIMNSYYRMLYRQLIYTGLTRAKKLAVFIGNRKSLSIAVNTLNSEKRQTSLKDFLGGLLEPI